jgi:hypothetical protein
MVQLPAANVMSWPETFVTTDRAYEYAVLGTAASFPLRSRRRLSAESRYGTR